MFMAMYDFDVLKGLIIYGKIVDYGFTEMSVLQILEKWWNFNISITKHCVAITHTTGLDSLVHTVNSLYMLLCFAKTWNWHFCENLQNGKFIKIFFKKYFIKNNLEKL